MNNLEMTISHHI